MTLITSLVYKYTEKSARRGPSAFFANSFKLKGVLYRNEAIPVCIKDFIFNTSILYNNYVYKL